MLLNVRSDPYHVIYIVPWNLLCCAKDILRILVTGGADDHIGEPCQQQLLQWRDKALHGEYLRKVDSGGELSLSFKWLLYGHLKMPMEALVVAAKDQALAVRAVYT